MKVKKLLENWDLTGLKLKLGFLETEWNPQVKDAEAAWELYVELLTRTATQPIPYEAGVEKTALGAEDHVPWEYHPNALNLVEDRKSGGLQLIALEGTVSSTPIFDFHPERTDQRVLALVIGNEKAGVDPGIIDLCEQVLVIPMMGGKGSLNVGVAFGIAAYWLSFV